MTATPNHDENDAIRAELDALTTDLQCARELLLHPAPKTAVPASRFTVPNTPSSRSFKSIKSARSVKSGKSERSIKTIKPKMHSPTKAFFARVAAPFRLVRARSQRKTYDKLERLDESRSLISDRRDSAESDDSDVTLVEAVAPEQVAPAADPNSASHILDILAPLISTLQRITPRMTSLSGIGPDLKEEHEEICAKLLRLVDELKEMTADGRDTRGGRDDHELEMTSLMLDALAKKIEKERGAIYRLSTVSCDESDSEWEETVVAEAELVQVRKGSDGSPLLPVGNNPFVLHSTSITLSARRGSESRPIPSSNNLGVGYQSFPIGVQPTWSRNVIRLGSYQNSLLFSPSPVAVRPMVSISEKL